MVANFLLYRCMKNFSNFRCVHYASYYLPKIASQSKATTKVLPLQELLIELNALKLAVNEERSFTWLLLNQINLVPSYLTTYFGHTY